MVKLEEGASQLKPGFIKNLSFVIDHRGGSFLNTGEGKQGSGLQFSLAPDTNTPPAPKPQETWQLVVTSDLAVDYTQTKEQFLKSLHHFALCLKIKCPVCYFVPISTGL